MVTSSDRVLAKETLGAVVRWQFPDLDEPQEVEAVPETAAPAAAGDTLRQQFSLLREVIGALSESGDGLDDAAINGIMTLAVDVTRRLRRRESHGSEPLLDAMQIILGGLPIGGSR